MCVCGKTKKLTEIFHMVVIISFCDYRFRQNSDMNTAVRVCYMLGKSKEINLWKPFENPPSFLSYFGKTKKVLKMYGGSERKKVIIFRFFF